MIPFFPRVCRISYVKPIRFSDYFLNFRLIWVATPLEMNKGELYFYYVYNITDY